MREHAIYKSYNIYPKLLSFSTSNIYMCQIIYLCITKITIRIIFFACSKKDSFPWKTSMNKLQLEISKGRHKRDSKNKKQETKRFSTFAVSRLRHSETKKTLLDSRIKFLAKHV